MMEDGGGLGDQYNFSQNKKSLFGKVMRLDASHLTYMKKHLEKECIIATGRGNCYIIQTKLSLYFTPRDPSGCSLVHWKSQHA